MDLAGNAPYLLDAITGGKMIDNLKESYNSFQSNGTMKDIARAVALSPVKLNDDRTTLSNITAGVVRNPHTTTFFDGIETRSFNLQWKMSARSFEESQTINNIIKTIRERMYPEESSHGYALEYPDLVYVDFEGESKAYLPQYYKAFISNMNITTASGTGMVFYTSGAPVEVEIQISFNETGIVTRNRLQGEQ
jgi:hypothetical protein